jgi:FixJ family two-component response regulator
MTATPVHTVCVVDDDPSVRSALRRLLRSAGWTVRTFASAEEFLQRDPDLACGCVIVDVHLGSMTGLELQVALGGREAAMSFVTTSGVDDAEIELEARRLGALAFIRKPFDVTALLESVRQGLELRAP